MVLYIQFYMQNNIQGIKYQYCSQCQHQDMDETKIEEILQKLFNKTNDLLDKKFAVMAA